MSHRLRKLALWSAGLLALAVVAVLVAVPFAIRRAVTPELVAHHASNAFDREVSVGEVGLHFTPLLRIRAERVAIEPDIRLGVVDVGLDIGSLLERRIEVGVVEVEDASLTLVRRADGGIELHGSAPVEEGLADDPDVATEEPEDGPALPSLPELDLHHIELVLVDHAAADPPRRTRLWVDHLELQRVAEGERPRLSLDLHLGEGEEAGRLALDARLGPLDLARDWDEQRFEAKLQAEGLATEPLLPYLPADVDLRRLTGRLTGRVSVLGPSWRQLAGELAVSLLGGGLDVAGLRLEDPRFTGRLAPEDGSVSVTDGRLEARELGFDEYAANDLSMVFSFSEGSLEVESLEFDSLAGKWRRASEGEGDDPEADELEVHVRRSGRIALRGRWHLPSESELADSARAVDAELPDLEVRDAEVVIVHAAGSDPRPLQLQVDRLELRDVAAGETATGQLEARLGEDGRGGSLSLRGSAGPLAWETPLARLPMSLQLSAEQVDLAPLAKLLPERWQPDRMEGRLGGEIDTEGRELANLSLQLGGGRLEMNGVGIEGDAKLKGRLRTGPAGLAVDTGQLSVQTLTFAERRAEDLEARFTYADDTLQVESLELRAYQGTVTGSGRIRLGTLPDFDLELAAAGVRAAPAFGMTTRSDEPTLLEAEAGFRGSLTDEPNWLAPLEGGGRVAIRGGVFPSQALLTAVARSLLRLVPGFSRSGVTENPRLARLEALTSTFRVEEGRLVTDDLSVRTEDLCVTGRGGLSHELDLDFRLLVGLTTRGVSTAFSLSRTHEQLREGALLPAVPVRVTGPIGNQSFQVDARAMPVVTLRGALGLPARAGALGRGVAGTVRDTPGGARRLRGGQGEGEPEEPPPSLPE